MKTLLTSAILLLFLLGTSALAQNQTLTLDPKASQLKWTGFAEIGSWAPTGTVQLQKGQFVQRGKQISTGTFVINMTSIQHENSQMQEHLRGEDFFDVAQFPTATFTLRSLIGSTATGQLTIRGVTKPLSFPVVITQEGDAMRIKGTANIDRTQFNIRYNSSNFFSGLGDQAIKNEFTLAFDVLARPTAVTKRNQGRLSR